MKQTPSDPELVAESAAESGPYAGGRSITIPWGPEGSLELRLPAGGLIALTDVDIVSPDLSDPLNDYPGALERALESPMGSDRLEQHLTPGARVAIIVDDPSRWTPVREALPIILRRLHRAGIRDDDVTISVGVGRHRAVDAEAMRRRVGDSIAARHRCFSPPVDDRSAYVDLGLTRQGVPVRVFRPVAQADLRILVGSVLPHLQAGFGGGYKLIFPGTSHRSTLGSLHHQGLGAQSDAAGLLGGDAASNPMRQAIYEAASKLGPCWSISHLIGRLGQVFRVIAGHPEPVQDLLAAEARKRFCAPAAPAADLIVAGNDPWPGDPMQSFKVLLHHRTACRAGGVLVGLFWTDPAEIDRSFPIGTLRSIAATRALGGWTIRRFLPVAERAAAAAGSPVAFMLRWARELVVDRRVLVYAPPLYERVGPRLGPVQLFGNQAALWHAAAAAFGQDSRARPAGRLRLRLFPHGGLTYAQGHGS
ncbi:MAG TPA: lactate racemase domain-containing protein [Isosphaeraceae bacterium]|nr:lactate racemase domain-containing protein [Isosphaeraceae bacterium]